MVGGVLKTRVDLFFVRHLSHIFSTALRFKTNSWTRLSTEQYILRRRMYIDVWMNIVHHEDMVKWKPLPFSYWSSIFHPVPGCRRCPCTSSSWSTVAKRGSKDPKSEINKHAGPLREGCCVDWLLEGYWFPWLDDELLGRIQVTSKTIQIYPTPSRWHCPSNGYPRCWCCDAPRDSPTNVAPKDSRALRRASSSWRGWAGIFSEIHGFAVLGFGGLGSVVVGSDWLCWYVTLTRTCIYFEAHSIGLFKYIHPQPVQNLPCLLPQRWLFHHCTLIQQRRYWFMCVWCVLV